MDFLCDLQKLKSTVLEIGLVFSTDSNVLTYVTATTTRCNSKIKKRRQLKRNILTVLYFPE